MLGFEAHLEIGTKTGVESTSLCPSVTRKTKQEPGPDTGAAKRGRYVTVAFTCR